MEPRAAAGYCPPMRWLYLHGFASGPRSSKGVALERHLAEAHGVTLQCLDLRQPSMARLRGEAMIAHVEQAMGAPTPEPTVLIGSSLGGWVAARVAERNPQVRALGLLAPAIGLAARWRARMPNAVERWERTGWMTVEDHALGGTAEVDIGFLHDIERIEEAGPPDVRVPTLVVHGRGDDVVSIDGSRAWAASRPNVRLVEVDDGHQLAAALPRIQSELDAFLAELDLRGVHAGL